MLYSGSVRNDPVHTGPVRPCHVFEPRHACGGVLSAMHRKLSVEWDELQQWSGLRSSFGQLLDLHLLGEKGGAL